MTTVDRPGVTVLKPLCGAEPRLYENLAGFCTQDYPDYQIVVGVRSPADESLAVVDRIIADFPERDIVVVVDATEHGANRKISNLLNALPYARHDRLVLADSDISVQPGYLSAVTEPLHDPTVGVVTCLYTARAAAAGWAGFGTLFVNAWFRTAVRVDHALGSRNFGFGATLALRRSTLDLVGGFLALRDQLADDYWLAKLARRHGLRTVLSPVEVTTDVVETRLRDLLAREIRWLRTIRSVNLPGFLFVFLSFTMPWLLGGVWWTVAWYLTPPAAPIATARVLHAAVGVLVLAGLAARGTQLWRARPTALGVCRGFAASLLRDVVLAAEWAVALFGTTVTWRGIRLSVDRSAPCR